MNQPGVFEHRQAFEQLLRENLDELGTETLELVLLDQLVQVGRETFKDKTQVVLVGEGVVHSKDMIFVPWIVRVVELHLSV